MLLQTQTMGMRATLNCQQIWAIPHSRFGPCWELQVALIRLHK